jgi:hypothetical protein
MTPAMMLDMQPIRSLRFVTMLASQPAIPPNTIQLKIPMVDTPFLNKVPFVDSTLW